MKPEHTDPCSPDLSVVIPTRHRLGQLERCLRSLMHVELNGASIEILVTVDGPDSGERELVRRLGISATVIEGDPGGGPGRARNRAIDVARGELLLLLNDDVEADPGLISAHLRAHERRDPGSPAMVLGAAPWVVHQPDRLFDRLIRESSMVFFYDRMPPHAGPTDPDHDWGFRHAWTLNLSVPTRAAREVGGFSDRLPNASFEDLEWAWRITQEFGSPVLFRPEARVNHDHRYEPCEYLQREQRLGRDAWALAGANPECALDVFGRELRTEDELSECRVFVEKERAAIDRLESTFGELANRAANEGDDPAALTELYREHLPLKRWHWRCGLLEAAAADPEFSPARPDPIHAA